MTAPTFRPIDATAFDDLTALSAEHGRRLVRDTLAGLNQRPMQVGQAFRRYAGDATELRTLWRWCINWGYIGPWRVYSPRDGTVRVLLGLRTNGGAGAVRLYVVPDRGRPSESTMTTNTNSATVGEQAYYRLTTSSADIALILPVTRGWNVFSVAIRCEEDTGRTRETFTGVNLSTFDTIAFARQAPSLDVEPVDNDPIGMFAEAAQSSSEHTSGLFDSYTVAAMDGAGEKPILFEPASFAWRVDVVDPDAVRYVEIGWTTALYIDSISIDGTGALTLEDRAFGAAFRYRQTLSATFAGQAVAEAQVAHTARLPMVAIGTDLDGTDTANADEFPSLRKYAVMTGSAVTLATIGLGVAAATPAIDWQELLTGKVYRFEVQFSAILTRVSPIAVAPDPVEFVAVIVDAAGATLATGDVVTQTLPVLTQRDQPAATQALASGEAVASANSYGAEGMTLRDDLSLFVVVTISVTATGNLDVAAVQRLRIQAAGAALNLMCITPPAVRMVEQ
jgi:hypothetical protein